MKITVLGYYGGYPFNGGATSAYLVQSAGFNLLLDCGSGALLELEQHLDPLKLNAVILTHYHADHIADVGVLQHYWQLNPGAKQVPNLPIYGHDQDQENFTRLNWPNATHAVAYHPDHSEKLGPFSINFLQTKHPVTTFAMRVTEDQTGNSFVFTADTTWIDELESFVQNTNLLITDTNFLTIPDGPKWHLTASESGRLAQIGQVQQLLLSHLPQNIDYHKLVDAASHEFITGTVQAASTGAIYEI